MLVDTIKAQALQAMKAKDALATSILRLALGEVQTAEARTNRKATDDEVTAVVRKLIKSNDETLAVAVDEDQKRTLGRENAVLAALLPATLTPEQIAESLAPVAAAIREAKSEGQATGVAMKHLKTTGAVVSGTAVGAAVKQIRG